MLVTNYGQWFCLCLQSCRGMLENCLLLLAYGVMAHFAVNNSSAMSVQRGQWALLSGWHPPCHQCWNCLWLPPSRAGWHSGCFFGEAFANMGISGWSLQSRSVFWRSCSLISAFSFLLQLKVARAAASSRGDHPKSGPSGRASITTSKVGTSIRTRSPVRRRCSRWGELTEPKVPLTSSHGQFE